MSALGPGCVETDPARVHFVLAGNLDVGKRPAYFTIHITTPYCPITTDGKEPNLGPFLRVAFVAATKDQLTGAPLPTC